MNRCYGFAVVQTSGRYSSVWYYAYAGARVAAASYQQYLEYTVGIPARVTWQPL